MRGFVRVALCLASACLVGACAGPDRAQGGGYDRSWLSGPFHQGWGGAREIHKAAHRGNVAKIHTAIDHGEDPNAKASIPYPDFKTGGGSHRFTPLQLAIRNRQERAVQALVARGVRPTPDDVAFAVCWSPSIVGSLVDAGAPVNGRLTEWPYEQAKALHVSADRGETKAAEALLARGADIHARDRDGDTPLHVAARYVRLDTVRLLVANGADATLVNAEGRTPLREAVAYSGAAQAERLRPVLDAAIRDR